jgi:hypothetical protein
MAWLGWMIRALAQTRGLLTRRSGKMVCGKLRLLAQNMIILWPNMNIYQRAPQVEGALDDQV